MATKGDIELTVRDCVKRCGAHKNWFLWVIAYVHRLVRRDELTEAEGCEVIYQSRKRLRRWWGMEA